MGERGGFTQEHANSENLSRNRAEITDPYLLLKSYNMRQTVLCPGEQGSCR